ncbi:IS1096 element passenger TnpR family protein [Methylobacterium aquaticum]|uniref:IS1096 element passenger TnpR family protein n=1 Tax=Methylobacterium aquaticum TaxID=270351 RepID=UPI003CC9E610
MMFEPTRCAIRICALHDWHHEIALETVKAANPAAEYPRFLSGACRAPPEYVGAFQATRSLFERSPINGIASIRPC